MARRRLIIRKDPVDKKDARKMRGRPPGKTGSKVRHLKVILTPEVHSLVTARACALNVSLGHFIFCAVYAAASEVPFEIFPIKDLGHTHKVGAKRLRIFAPILSKTPPENPFI